MARHAIGRAFIALAAAIRDIPATTSEEHNLPARPITGFRNALAHTYEDIVDERMLLTIREDLPVLYRRLDAIQSALASSLT